MTKYTKTEFRFWVVDEGTHKPLYRTESIESFISFVLAKGISRIRRD